MSDIDNRNQSKFAEDKLLSWLRVKFGEGMAVLKKERAFEQMPEAVRYLEGKHQSSKNKAISNVWTNRLRKIALETVATMTDVRPIWNYETYVDEYKPQGGVMNKLARAWWRNTNADSRLASILLYACAGGTGYGLLTWNKDIKQGEGDLELVPFDPRDVIPIDPVYSDDIQMWRGIMLRQRFPVEEGRGDKRSVRNSFPRFIFKPESLDLHIRLISSITHRTHTACDFVLGHFRCDPEQLIELFACERRARPLLI